MRAAAIALALLALAAGCGGDSGGDEAAMPEEECRMVDAPGPKEVDAPPKPTEGLDRGQTYRLVFETSCGRFTVALDPEQGPNAAASLVSLARSGYFDGTVFHRVVPDFVVQGGDPTGRGDGGPGYSTRDQPAFGTTYVAGVVAMAKAPAEPAGTAGSQFFVVTAQDAGLPPDYAVVGRVVEGMDAVRRIEALGDVQTQRPRQPVVLERVTVETE